MPSSDPVVSAAREGRRIAAQAAVAATLTCLCEFRDGRWFYCAEHFAGQHDPSEISRCPGCGDQASIPLPCTHCGRRP